MQKKKKVQRTLKYHFHPWQGIFSPHNQVNLLLNNSWQGQRDDVSIKILIPLTKFG